MGLGDFTKDTDSDGSVFYKHTAVAEMEVELVSLRERVPSQLISIIQDRDDTEQRIMRLTIPFKIEGRGETETAAHQATMEKLEDISNKLSDEEGISVVSYGLTDDKMEQREL